MAKAQFRVDEFLNIVGIGQILAGDILAGIVTPADKIIIDSQSTHYIYSINAVELIEYTAKPSKTALILTASNSEQNFDLNLLIGEVINIYQDQKRL